MNPFQSLNDYEEFIYTLSLRFASIQHSTLIVVRRGRRTAVLQGEIGFVDGYRISVKERLTLDAGEVVIEDYGYEMWHSAEKIAWYDSQPHPDDPMLASNHPHHKHVHPDIKHHRIPAPQMSFTSPNLVALIEEVEQLLV